MCEKILNTNHKNHIIEIHNRPYLFNYIYKKLIDHHICIFFHNDQKGQEVIDELLPLAYAKICWQHLA